MLAWLALLLLQGCGVEEPALPAPGAPQAAARAEADPASPAQAASAAVPASEPAPAPAPSPTRPLDDLLRLPEAALPERPDRAAERLRVAKPEEEPEATKRQPGLVRVELSSRTDDSAVPSTTRTRNEAGVSTQVGESTRVRAGVRVEQESGQQRDQPVPVVGVEKRF